MLRIEAVGKRYRGRSGVVQALEGVSLSCAPGEFVVVQGPSGAGKTTLLLVAGGLLAPDTGRVVLNGQDVYGLSTARRAGLRAAAVGFVFQQFHLVPYLDVTDNVMAPGLTAPHGDLSERCRALIDRLGLRERAHHLPADLSTGERQRTALARALVADPRLVLADEPTGNLDPGNAETVLKALRDFADTGRSVVLATHDPATRDYADRAAHLDRGLLADAGQPAPFPLHPSRPTEPE